MRRSSLTLSADIDVFTKLYSFRALMGFLWVAGWVSAVQATPPPNDNCAGAEVIPTAGPFPYLTSIVDVKDASATNDPPDPSCAAVSVDCGVWYRFTPPSTALYTISCSGDTATTVQDSVMAIYPSSGGCAGSFTEVDCSDDEGDLQSALARTLTSGVTYYVVVWMSSVSPPLTGKTFVQLRVTQPVQPANDTCAGAEIIPSGGPFPCLTAVTDTTRATNSAGDPTPSCWAPRIRSVWYRFTPDTTGPHELSLCTNTATTVYETLLAIYTASGCAGPFTQIACNHTNACANKLRSTINTMLTNGVTYHIVAWEGTTDPYIPGETSMQLRVARFLPPTVTNVFANALSSTGAVLNATVYANGANTFGYFQYGPTAGYGSTTTTINLGAGTGALQLLSTISGLTPAATYHFRCGASNSVGMTLGIDRTFTWSTNRPSLSALAGSGALTLQFAGQSGQIYAIEASTNLVNWSNLGQATDLTSGLFEFIATSSLPWRFYRTVTP